MNFLRKKQVNRAKQYDQLKKVVEVFNSCTNWDHYKVALAMHSLFTKQWQDTIDVSVYQELHIATRKAEDRIWLIKEFKLEHAL